jgi:hypothetical protein
MAYVYSILILMFPTSEGAPERLFIYSYFIYLFHFVLFLLFRTNHMFDLFGFVMFSGAFFCGGGATRVRSSRDETGECQFTLEAPCLVPGECEFTSGAPCLVPGECEFTSGAHTHIRPWFNIFSAVWAWLLYTWGAPSFVPITRMCPLLNDGGICENIHAWCEHVSHPWRGRPQPKLAKRAYYHNLNPKP